MSELLEKAKELGIKNPHLYKEENLKSKIEALEDKPESQEKKDGPREFEVVSGKFFMGGNIYHAGDKLKSKKDLSAHSNLREV